MARQLLDASGMHAPRTIHSAAVLVLSVGLAGTLGCDGHVGGGPVRGEKGPREDGPVVRLVDGGSGAPMEDDGPGDDRPDMVPPVPGDPRPDGGASYSCDELGYTGICDGDIARWCDNGELKMRDCAAYGQRCRWIDESTGYYCAGGSGGGGGTVDAGGGGGGGGGDTVPTECASAIEARELELTNEARASAGLPALECDEALARAARLHSQDMCDGGYFSHTSRDGRSFADRLREQGASFGAAGENIAAGQPTPEAVHEDWMNSPGHRANILGSAYRRIGIGYVDCGGFPYWTQDFTD